MKFGTKEFSDYGIAMQYLIKEDKEMKQSYVFDTGKYEKVLLGYGKGNIFCIYINQTQGYVLEMTRKEFNVYYNEVGMFRTLLAKAGVNGEI